MNNVICGLGAGICEAVFAVTPVESLGEGPFRAPGRAPGSAAVAVASHGWSLSDYPQQLTATVAD